MKACYFAIQIEIPETRCPKVRYKKRIIQDGKAKLFLSHNMSIHQLQNGKLRYGVSSGRNALLLTIDAYAVRHLQIKKFLDKKFDGDWELNLIPLMGDEKLNTPALSVKKPVIY